MHFDGDRYRLLAVRTFDSWDFPKAPVADGEDPLRWRCARRAKAPGSTSWSSPGDEAFRETLASEDGSVSRYYLAESNTAEVTLRVPPGDGGQEDFEYRWVTVEEAEESCRRVWL